MSFSTLRSLTFVSALLLAGVVSASAADLTVKEVDPSGVVVDCQTLQATGTVAAVVKNIGSDATGSGFSVVFFEDSNSNGTYESGVDLLFGDDFVDLPLGPGEETSVSTSVDAVVTFAGNLIYVFADSQDEVLETDETNNVATQDCEFEPPPGNFSPNEEWNWNSSLTYPNHAQVMMTPIVANLTDDNGDFLINDGDVPDVVFSTFANGAYAQNGVVRAVNGDDGTEIFTTPLTDDRDVLGEGSIAVGDIDGDGFPEIIANEDISETHDINAHGRLIVFEHDGTFKFVSDLMSEGRLRWGGAALADLNGDGTPEIVVGRQVLDNTGSILATGQSRRGDNGVGPLSTVADIDLDGIPDIVAGFTVYDVVLDGLDNIVGLDIKWEATDAAGGQIPGDGFSAVANFDDDDYGEVVVVSNSNVWLFDHDGSHLWGPVAIPGGGRGGPPNVDDFDNDGQVEVGTAGQARYAVYETDGSLRWSSVTFDTSSNVTGSSVFDFEGDGSAEVVYKDQTYLRVYRGTDGFVLAQIATGSGTTYENPVIADVDKDGNAEIIICANNYAYGSRRGIQVFGDENDQWVNTRRIWNQHTYHITNVDDDGTIPMNEAANWLTFNNFRSQESGTQVFSAPDLTASWIRLDTTNCPDEARIVARIGNGGTIVAAVPIDVSYYDGDPSMGGMLLGVTATTINLEPGEYEDVTLALIPPPAGPMTVCVVADDDGTGMGGASECDETNNMCCTEIEEFCPPPLIAVHLDLHPTSCPNPLNPRSKGVLPAAVVGTNDLDVWDIDPATLLLEGVAPIRTNVEDVVTPFDGELCDCTEEGPDGIDDLTVKFKTQDIVDALGELVDGDEIVLTLTGNLYDGTPIEGMDCMIVRYNVKDRDVIFDVPWPNPSNPVTYISYSLPGEMHVRLGVYDVSGRRVETLRDRLDPAGSHTVEWRSADQPSGTYFIRMEAAGQVMMRRVTLSK